MKKRGIISPARSARQGVVMRGAWFFRPRPAGRAPRNPRDTGDEPLLHREAGRGIAAGGDRHVGGLLAELRVPCMELVGSRGHVAERVAAVIPGDGVVAVSYTHLTLPTSDLV